MKPQCVISAARGWEYFAKDYLWTVLSKSFVMKPIDRLIQKRRESAKKFLFWEAKWNHVFFLKCFLLDHQYADRPSMRKFVKQTPFMKKLYLKNKF